MKPGEFGEFVKQAVNIQQLRSAYTKVVRPRKFRRALGTISESFSGIFGKAGYKGKHGIAAGVADFPGKPRLEGKIFKPGPQIREISKIKKKYGNMIPINPPNVKTKRSKEIVERSFGLHELQETKAKKPFYLFAGAHLGVKPPLNDLNIAATLKGQGSRGASNYLKTLRRPEIDFIHQLVPGSERLQLGKKRLSRHAIRRIDQIVRRSAFGQ